MDHGHPDAFHYPIAMVWDEATIIGERLKATLVTEAILVQAATATTGNTAGQKANQHWNKLIKTLSGE